MLMKNVLNKNGYYFDVDSLTLHMTKAYEKKSLIYGSEECGKVLEMRQRFPEMTIEVHKRKSSTTKPLSYKMMKAYIEIMPNAAEMLKEFERVQRASVAFKSPYKYVEKWFKANYPQYDKYVERDEEGNVTWKVTEMIAEAKRQIEAAKQNEQENGENAEERSVAKTDGQKANDVEAEASNAAGVTEALEIAA